MKTPAFPLGTWDDPLGWKAQGWWERPATSQVWAQALRQQRLGRWWRGVTMGVVTIGLGLAGWAWFFHHPAHPAETLGCVFVYLLTLLQVVTVGLTRRRQYAPWQRATPTIEQRHAWRQHPAGRAYTDAIATSDVPFLVGDLHRLTMLTKVPT